MSPVVLRWIIVFSAGAIAGGCAATDPLPANVASGQSLSTNPIAGSSTPSPAKSSPAATATEGPVAVELTFGEIPTEFTTPALDYRSDGTAVIWSSGAADGPESTSAPDLWRYAPGDPEPQVIFHNPDRDSTLDVVGGNGIGQYAFVERNERLYGSASTLWYLPEANAEPVLLAKTDGAGVLPFFTMGPEWIAWAAVEEIESGRASRLQVADLPGLERRVVAESPAEVRQFGFPSLDGNRLVYATVELTDGEAEFQAYLTDLLRPTAPAERLDDSGNVTMPVIKGDTVVWKVTPPGNAFGWGQLASHSLGDSDTTMIDARSMHTDPELSFNYPSVGDRFLAAWDPNHDSLYIYDLRSQQPLMVEDLGGDRMEGTREAVVGRPHVQGSLLAFIQGSDDAGIDLVLRYAVLPPP